MTHLLRECFQVVFSFRKGLVRAKDKEKPLSENEKLKKPQKSYSMIDLI